jgi:DNA-binding MarR family transcriptional regulator
MTGRATAAKRGRRAIRGKDGAIQLSPKAGSHRFLNDYLLYLLARASALVSGEVHAHLREQKVPLAVWRVLAVLDGTAGLTVGELAAACLFKQPTMTKALDRLAASGMVVRRGGEHDRRRVLVVATDKGRALVARLIADAKAHEARVLKDYSSTEIKYLKNALRRLMPGKS